MEVEPQLRPPLDLFQEAWGKLEAAEAALDRELAAQDLTAIVGTLALVAAEGLPDPEVMQVVGGEQEGAVQERSVFPSM